VYITPSFNDASSTRVEASLKPRTHPILSKNGGDMENWPDARETRELGALDARGLSPRPAPAPSVAVPLDDRCRLREIFERLHFEPRADVSSTRVEARPR